MLLRGRAPGDAEAAEGEPDAAATGVGRLAVTHGAVLVSWAGPCTGTVVDRR